MYRCDKCFRRRDPPDPLNPDVHGHGTERSEVRLCEWRWRWPWWWWWWWWWVVVVIMMKNDDYDDGDGDGDIVRLRGGRGREKERNDLAEYPYLPASLPGYLNGYSSR